MKLTKEQVQHVAKLANLSLSDEDIDKYSNQLSAILDYIEQLQGVDTQGVEPTYSVTGLENIWREDQSKESLSQDAALQNATNKQNGFFVTKGVFSEE